MTTATTPKTPKLAVITGATVDLGRELVKELIAQDITVAALGRNETALNALGNETSNPDLFHAFETDLTSFADIKASFAKITEKFGAISILIYNAAIETNEDFLEQTPESFAHVMQINLCAAQACAFHAVTNMVETGYGRIVNVVSFADQAPAPLATGYSVSKGAQKTLTRAMLADLGDRFPDIVITDWVPGAHNTSNAPADGVDPATAAKWGVKLALMHDPSLSGALFFKDREQPAPKSRKKKILDKLLGTRTPIRTLS